MDSGKQNPRPQAQVLVVIDARDACFDLAWQAMFKTYYGMFPLKLSHIFHKKCKKYQN